MQKEIHVEVETRAYINFPVNVFVFNTVALFPCPLRGSARHIFLVNRRSAF